jgi:hypothetical protein
VLAYLARLGVSREVASARGGVAFARGTWLHRAVLARGFVFDLLAWGHWDFV